MPLTNTSLPKRLLIATPFVIATLLNVLMVAVERFHFPLEHIAAYGFVFGTPWAWLLNSTGLSNLLDVNNRWLGRSIGYAVILWIPALLYSLSVWLLLVVFRISTRLISSRLDPEVVNSLKRRLTVAAPIIVMAGVGWFGLKLYRGQVDCNHRAAVFARRVESIKRDAHEQLTIGTKKADVTRFFAEHGIPFG